MQLFLCLHGASSFPECINLIPSTNPKECPYQESSKLKKLAEILSASCICFFTQLLYDFVPSYSYYFLFNSPIDKNDWFRTVCR